MTRILLTLLAAAAALHSVVAVPVAQADAPTGSHVPRPHPTGVHPSVGPGGSERPRPTFPAGTRPTGVGEGPGGGGGGAVGTHSRRPRPTGTHRPRPTGVHPSVTGTLAFPPANPTGGVVMTPPGGGDDGEEGDDAVVARQVTPTGGFPGGGAMPTGGFPTGGFPTGTHSRRPRPTGSFTGTRTRAHRPRPTGSFVPPSPPAQTPTNA
ncbi:hypothetical protein QBC46DRAFT_413544 [Diplogelasinospora grovesii]|uniref:Uncharacterized protein n=1 Tax=Diplogelasinospora grovesii TaxID=303347 RepID=A0AAN6MWN6_9PEZI|nr:hypothetical protein QBC46DRAFT_413544 [Diplogelasinospora grovesii]